MKTRGQVLITMMVLTFVALLFITGLVSWAIGSKRVSQKIILRERAFQIAEAGNEYYRWHLAHAREDYQDGQSWCCSSPPCTWCGPYVHDYKDKDGNVIGQFSLRIKPPTIGSTLVTIESTGKVVGETLLKRVIETKLAIPSWTKYAVAANDKMRFGYGTEVFGEIHSNDGIRFDGVAHNIVTSAKTTYDDPDHDGSEEWAVHTHAPPNGQDPIPPNPWNNRTDVFKAGRQVSVPAIDFAGISGDLSQIKTQAQQNGRYFAHSGVLGYYISLKTNDTFDLYKVTSLMPRPSNFCTANQDGWGTWSIQNKTFLQNYSFPNNGLIFVEDNLWVDGQINTARLTIASARFPENPSTNTSITINNDLKYTNYDGQDVIGLIAQKNINVGLYSEDDLQIDAALIAKNGRVGRYYYNQQYCSNYALRQKITLNGMIGTNQRYGFSYVCGENYCSGYNLRILNYDANLLYGPPPNFPLTSDQYTTLSWREIY